MNMLNIAVDASKVPAVALQRSPGYWQTVGQRLLGIAVIIIGVVIVARS